MNPHFYGLQVCGLLPTSISSSYAANTIRDWQDQHGLVADGFIGPATAEAMHLDAEARGLRVPHFDYADYAKGLKIPPQCMSNVRRILRMCEVRRLVVFGGVPCNINAGARDRERPRNGGQAKNSYHYITDTDGKTPRCMAADMTPVKRGTGTDPKEWDRLTKEAMLDGRLSLGGFQTYFDQPASGEFQHADSRGTIVDGW